MYWQNWHKHYQPVQSYSTSIPPSFPPTIGNDRDTNQHRASWYDRSESEIGQRSRKQCQDCYPGHSGINGKNLAFLLPQVSHSKLSLQRFSTMKSFVRSVWGWGRSMFKAPLFLSPSLSLSVCVFVCYSFRPRYNFVFSVVYTLSEL